MALRRRGVVAFGGPGGNFTPDWIAIVALSGFVGGFRCLIICSVQLCMCASDQVVSVAIQLPKVA